MTRSSPQVERRDGEAVRRLPGGRSPTLIEIAERCGFDLSSDLGYNLPEPDVPEGYTPMSYLVQAVLRVCRYEGTALITERVENRLREEFRLIERNGMAGLPAAVPRDRAAGQGDHGRARAGRPGGGARGTTARPGSRLVRRAAGGLSRRHKPRRSPQVGPRFGEVHIRGRGLASGHRPGLSQGHKGRTDREGA